MAVLPNYLAPGLKIIFCGTAVGKSSAIHGHYYSHPRNEFWHCLHASGLTPVRLHPNEDHLVLNYGLGLTDLAKTSQGLDRGLRSTAFDVQGFADRISRHAPAWVAFNGKGAAAEVARRLGYPSPAALGTQGWRVGPSEVFVLPSTSPASADPSHLQGKASKAEWFADLAVRAVG